MNVHVKTDYPVAITSFDYLHPLGAIKDNSRNQKFNNKLYKIFPGDVADLGCAGGGFVKNCIEDGFFAIGLEGNDFGYKNKWAEWATIPQNLFTCDITKPFKVLNEDGEIHKFRVITAWEVIEHIEKSDLSTLFTNIKNHLSDNGVFITSISNKKSPSMDNEVDLHRIHEDDNWWTKKLSQEGFVRDPEAENYFAGDWVRNERRSFHFVMYLI